jgi:hypothetical protein
LIEYIQDSISTLPSAKPTHILKTQFYSKLKLEIFAGSFKLIEKDKRALHLQAKSFLLGLL